jgi:hypothetical protein
MNPLFVLELQGRVAGVGALLKAPRFLESIKFKYLPWVKIEGYIRLKKQVKGIGTVEVSF